MIRINLLPRAKKQSRAAGPSGSGQLWAGLYLGSLVLFGIGLGVVYSVYSGQLEAKKQRNSTLDRQIAEARQRSAGLEDLQAQMAASLSLEEVVGELNRARTGPVRVVMELSKILSRDRGPTIDPQALERLRQNNPLANFNRNWDVRRLWLTSFEEENRECRLVGLGRTNEDVAEFLQRLSLSELFENVTLQKTESATDEETGLSLIGFELTARVRY
ncbi:MAG: PilN domain-containing protein [Deltaproteobacteria bacterium]|nr:PilN domain-containing protein [Deltaproteobacteria bacterium]